MTDRRILKRVFSIAFNRKFLYALAILLYAIQDFAYSAYISFVQYFSVSIIEKGNLADFKTLVLISLAVYGIIIVLLSAGMLLIDYVRIMMENKLKSDVLERLFKNKISVATSQIDNLSQALINDSSSVSFFLTYTVSSYVSPAVTLIGFSIILIRINIIFALAVVASIVMQITYNLLVKSRVRKAETDSVKLNAGYLTKIKNQIKMVTTVKLYNLFDRVQSENESLRSGIRKNNLLVSVVANIRKSVSNLLNIVLTFGVFTMAIKLYSNQQISIAAITLIPMLLGGVISSVEQLLSLSVSSQKTVAASQNILNIIDGEDGKKTDRSGSDFYDFETVRASAKYALKVDGLTFAYGDSNVDPNVIEDLSLEVKRGEIVRVYGGIGSGKSTLIQLLMGFLKPQKGSIEAFGVDKNTVCEKDWLSNFSYVEQDPVLFDLTVRENIEVGLLDSPDPDRLEKVLEITGINQMAEKLEKGLDTMVGSRGTALSGGERQLVCFARAMYSRCPVLILDEFSSSMDRVIEQKIMEALKELKEDKTIIYISHRESSSHFAGRTINLKIGKEVSESNA